MFEWKKTYRSFFGYFSLGLQFRPRLSPFQDPFILFGIYVQWLLFKELLSGNLHPLKLCPATAGHHLKPNRTLIDAQNLHKSLRTSLGLRTITKLPLATASPAGACWTTVDVVGLEV